MSPQPNRISRRCERNEPTGEKGLRQRELKGIQGGRPIRKTAAVQWVRHGPSDTDRIIPARFLRKRRSAGYGQFCFHDLRVRPDGTRIPDSS